VECAVTVNPESRLDFTIAARAAFGFLEQAPYDMVLDSVAEGIVRYAGNGVVVAVVHDRLSYELDVQLGRVNVPDEMLRPFTMQDLIRAVDASLGDAFKRFAATSVGAVERGCAELADQLRRYGDPALRGSNTFFDAVSIARAVAVQQFGQRLTDAAGRRRAEQAWAERDYASAAAAYASIIDISPAEARRLEIARQRMNGEAKDGSS
jgi:hypothetical protein